MKFKRPYREALCDFMTEDELSIVFEKLMENAKGTQAEAYITICCLFKEKRGFTYAGRHFICTFKGVLSHAESTQVQLKDNGSRKGEIRHWSIVDLLKKHVKYDVVGYVTGVTALIEQAILKKYYSLKYVSDLEDKEAKHVEGLKIVSVQYDVTNPLKQKANECDLFNVYGALYVIRIKGNSNVNNAVMVFVTNDVAYHCQSNYYVHTAFWIRDRYSQHALVIGSRLRSHTDTIHKLWDIRGHPLFNEVLEKLRKLSQIEGIDTPIINTDGDDVGETDNIILKKHREGPTPCQGRYAAVKWLSKITYHKSSK